MQICFLQGQDEGGEDVATPSEDVRESDVSHEQEEHENEAPEREDDILVENEIGHDIELPDQEIRRHQHAWGAGLSLGRHPYNPHAIDRVIHAESAAEAAEARSRLQTVHDPVQGICIFFIRIVYHDFFTCASCQPYPFITVTI